MNILITGGCGFIGSHIARKLALSNSVFVIDDLSTGSHDNLDRDDFGVFDPIDIANVIEDTITDYTLIDILMEKWNIDTVVHLAAQPSLQTSIEDPKHDANVNLIGTLNLIKASLKYGVRRFVFASTSAVYEEKFGGVYLENDNVCPVCPYGISKAAAERYIAISGLSYAVLRLGNVYGPKQKPLGENQLIPRALSHIYQGSQFYIHGDGTQSRDFIYVDDVVNAFVAAIESEYSGIFNIANGESIEVNEILSILKGITKFDKPFIHGDPKPGELHSVKLLNFPARRILKWEPKVSLYDGLKKTAIAWPK
jgi:UDP-glucose 4-epimerase